jgi:gamma-glutamylcyclotransferase (GGCT)/AIG2-like uncharacterized protein YtfP
VTAMKKKPEKESKEKPAGDLTQLPVFVYGTLRPGQKNYAPFLAGRTLREAPATIEGRLFFVTGEGYPYLLPGGGTVRGDLVELRPEVYEATLRSLDRLEEYDSRNEPGSVYLRRRGRVTLLSGREVLAWVYYWNGLEDAGDRVEGGDFGNREGSEG